MISYAAAVEVIHAAAQPLPAQSIRLEAALGTVAAEETRSPAAVPPFANAAMDGFALCSAHTRAASTKAPVRLNVAGSIAAGQPPPAGKTAGSAWEIMTGAAMPEGCDTVIAVERAETLTDTSGRPTAILVREPLEAGQNRRAAAEDFAVGDVMLRAGDPLSAQAVMALAAVGHDAVAARPAPRLAVIATGSELAVAGSTVEAAHSACIRDTNGPYLAAALGEMRIPLLARQTIPDDADRLAGELSVLAERCDIILTTGGVSAGRLDIVPDTVKRIGGQVLFHKVAIRPGKPLLFARLPGGALMFGLPGNPMAVVVGLRFFVLPAIRALMGRRPESHLVARAREVVRKRASLTFFAKAVAEVSADATLMVRLLPGQESFKISPLLKANCWAIVPEGRENVSAGEIMQIAPLLPTDFPFGR